MPNRSNNDQKKSHIMNELSSVENPTKTLKKLPSKMAYKYPFIYWESFDEYGS